mgnify:CR=1 FL=1
MRNRKKERDSLYIISTTFVLILTITLIIYATT